MLTTIDLNRLRAHPANSNVMPERLLKKLMAHIERSGRYPPILVRPLTQEQEQAYQILDGHHRAAALRRLGRSSASCIVWEVTDDEALLLLATLNRLQGQDDPMRRGDLLEQLALHLDDKTLAARLPESMRDLARLKVVRHPPEQLAQPRPLADMPVAVHFFLLPAQRDTVESALAMLGPTRERALVELCQQAVAQSAAAANPDAPPAGP